MSSVRAGSDIGSSDNSEDPFFVRGGTRYEMMMRAHFGPTWGLPDLIVSSVEFEDN